LSDRRYEIVVSAQGGVDVRGEPALRLRCCEMLRLTNSRWPCLDPFSAPTLIAAMPVPDRYGVLGSWPTTRPGLTRQGMTERSGDRRDDVTGRRRRAPQGFQREWRGNHPSRSVMFQPERYR
jgi:hypothetical protein